MNNNKIMLKSIKSGSRLKKLDVASFQERLSTIFNIIHFRQLEDVSTAPGYYNIGTSNC